MNYTSLFIDLDNTLLDFNKAESVAIREVLAENDLPHDDKTVKTYSEINKSFWERFERKEITKDAIFIGRFEVFLKILGTDKSPQEIAKEYGKQLSMGYYTVKGAFPILDYLKSRGYKLYATTNGISFTQYRRIERSGLKPYFDKVFVSEDAKHQKPEKEYFDYVINNIAEKNKSNMLIVGDSQSSDILGGINAGIDTCWYNPNGEKKKYFSRYEISSLEQLKDIL